MSIIHPSGGDERDTGIAASAHAGFSTAPAFAMRILDEHAEAAASLEADIEKVHRWMAERTGMLNGLLKGVTEEGPEREVLDAFLEKIGLEKNNQTRHIAYLRL